MWVQFGSWGTRIRKFQCRSCSTRWAIDAQSFACQPDTTNQTDGMTGDIRTTQNDLCSFLWKHGIVAINASGVTCYWVKIGEGLKGTKTTKERCSHNQMTFVVHQTGKPQCPLESIKMSHLAVLCRFFAIGCVSADDAVLRWILTSHGWCTSSVSAESGRLEL